MLCLSGKVVQLRLDGLACVAEVVAQRGYPAHILDKQVLHLRARWL